MSPVPLPPPPARASGPTPLDGIQVVEFGHFIAGPYAGMILGDLGADVVKVENSGRGDDFRQLRPAVNGIGGAFLAVNRNKRAVALDLNQADGRRVARALALRADVVIENYSAGVLARFGLDHATLAAENPRLITCSISAYGRDGPWASRAGFDQVVQAESGLMALNGEPDGDGVLMGLPIVDLTTAMMAANAVLAALVARWQTGRGQQLDLALIDQAVALLSYKGIGHLIDGAEPARPGNGSVMAQPFGRFAAADGDVFICCANDRFFQRLAIDVLDDPGLAGDPRFATMAGRVTNAEPLLAAISAAFRGDTRAAWAEKFRRAGVPGGLVNTVTQAFADPMIRSRAAASALPDPLGSFPDITSAMRFADTPLAAPRRAPLHGEHTLAVLRDVLALDEEAVAALGRTGAAVGPGMIARGAELEHVA